MMRWNSTKTYTEEDMIRMQQEAVNRVHEFQTRAREAASFWWRRAVPSRAPRWRPQRRWRRFPSWRSARARLRPATARMMPICWPLAVS